MRATFVFGLFFAFFLAAFTADAHRRNESYVYFSVTDAALTGRIEATLQDLDLVVPLDSNRDGAVSRQEFLSRSAVVFSFFSERLTIAHEGTTYPIVQSEFAFLDTALGTFAQIHFTVPGLSPTPDAVEVAYRSPFDDVAAGHLGYALIENNTRSGIVDNESRISLIFDRGGSQTLSLVGDPPLKIFRDFIVHGIWHIWLGFDHVLFLITLLLPAVLILSSDAWRPVESFRNAAINVIKLATIFTVAHTITLSLASLGVIQLPVRLVETIIAASIVVVALSNMFPVYHHLTLWVVFIFGLFHGFGFANVLAPLGVNASAKIVGLAAFNIGVEIGQIAIIAVVFPLLFVLRGLKVYPFLALRVASAGFILIAAMWLVERNSGFFYRLQLQLLGA